METYQQARRTRTQNEAEIDSLRTLWSGVIRTFTPNTRRFAEWLRIAGYIETTRCINDVSRNFIRLDGYMAPGQLIACMDRNITQTILRQQKTVQA